MHAFAFMMYATYTGTDTSALSKCSIIIFRSSNTKKREAANTRNKTETSETFETKRK